MWKLALRNVLRHKTRTGMTLLAIIVGVVGLILSGGFVQDIFTQLGEVLIHSQSGHMQVARDGYFEQGRVALRNICSKPRSPLRESNPGKRQDSMTSWPGVFFRIAQQWPFRSTDCR
jgi:hypothetical protein